MSEAVKHDVDAPRLLLVHAHPDDETTTTGGTIAKYCASGAAVTLVTCTRGERGENVLVGSPGYGEGEDDAAEQLARMRVAELEQAASALGLTDVRFLGGRGTWWDSGMADARVHHPRAFSDGSLAEQTAQLVAILREVRPHVVLTYDEHGGYGHPDHIRAHQVAVAAFDAAADPSAFPEAGPAWEVSRLYAAVLPYSTVRRAAELLAAAGFDVSELIGSAQPTDVPEDAMPFAVPDELIAVRVDAREWNDAKTKAMRAYRTQLAADSWLFVFADDPRRGFAVEHYQLLRGRSGASVAGVEDDLFAGLRGATSAWSGR